MQIGRLYGSNRHASQPAHLYLTGLNMNETLYQECVKKNDGFKSYLVSFVRFWANVHVHSDRKTSMTSSFVQLQTEEQNKTEKKEIPTIIYQCTSCTIRFAVRNQFIYMYLSITYVLFITFCMWSPASSP